MKINKGIIDEIQEFWGTDRLYQWLLERLFSLELSDETKIFLSKIGVPKVKPFNEVIWFFEEFIDLIPIKIHFEKSHIKHTIPSNIESSYVFATECEGICCFCICIEGERIIYFNPEIKESVRYCNSSIEMFCYFLTEFYRTALYVRKNQLDEDSELKLIKSIIEKLQMFDPNALEIEDSFWNTILLDFQ